MRAWLKGEDIVKRKLVGRAVLAGALTLGLGAGTVATALPASAGVPPTTITVTDQNKPSDVVFVDNGAPGFSVGDQVIFHSVLSSGGGKVGALDVTCTFVVRNRQDCHGTVHLFGRGKINFAGVTPEKSSFVFSIAGGTGEFVGALGSVFVNTKNSTDAGNGDKIVITLI